MKTSAIIPCPGIGDGLLMMIAAYQLHLHEYKVTIFHDHLPELKPWFPNQIFARKHIFKQSLKDFDTIILQHDNTSLTQSLIKAYRDKIYILYAGYDIHRHPPITNNDYIFNNTLPMTININQAIACILKTTPPQSPSNGITPPSFLHHRKYSNRILIHPTSTDPQREWKPEYFLNIGKYLQKYGYEVIFILSPDERPKWLHIPFKIPIFNSLSDLSNYIYESYLVIGNESGIVHLASNLKIYTLTIACCHKTMRLWKPGFLTGCIMTPSPYIPNIKGLRIRKPYWKTWVRPYVIKRQLNQILPNCYI